MPLPSSPHIYRHAPVVFFGRFLAREAVAPTFGLGLTAEGAIHSLLLRQRQLSHGTLLQITQLQRPDRHPHQAQYLHIQRC
jgi:hypothetical protein